LLIRYASLTVVLMEPEAEKIMHVHRQTGWPVLRCREVLTQTGGDVDAAIRVLREQYQTDLTEEQKAELEKSGSWVDRLRGDA
jgi:translation elongation factor EF-Ts